MCCPSGSFIYESREGSETPPFCSGGFSFGRMDMARHLAAALLVLSLRAFHHSTNIRSGMDIDDLEVGENLPRRKSFDFLFVQAVEPIKGTPARPQTVSDAFWRGMAIPLVSDNAPAAKHGARSTFIFAASLARSRPRSRRLSSRRALRAARQVLEFLSESYLRLRVRPRTQVRLTSCRKGATTAAWPASEEFYAKLLKSVRERPTMT
jgi:hypothetical protein